MYKACFSSRNYLLIIVLMLNSVLQAVQQKSTWKDALDDTQSYVVEKYDTSKDYVQDKYDDAKDYVVKKYDTSEDYVQDKYGDAKGYVVKKYDKVKDYIVDAYDDTKNYVAKKYSKAEKALKTRAHSVISIKSQRHFERIINTHALVVAKFYSPGCPHCRNYAKPFEAAAQDYTSATFIQINTDEHRQLSNNYLVGGIPVTIIFKNAKEVKRIPGSQSVDQLLASVQQANK